MQTTTSQVFNTDSINSDSYNWCFYQEMQWDKHKSDQYRSPATQQIQNNENIDNWSNEI